MLPIDDSDMGCDCAVKCQVRSPWTRQTAAIDNVMICGVHLNMCVLGRPFGIRQMVKLGKNVALMRDMTDTMYNPERPPGVSHFKGTELVIEHVEKYWCPTFLSSDITGAKAFRFRDAPGGEGVVQAASMRVGCVNTATPVLAGIDVLHRDAFRQLEGRRVGLITNQTGVNRQDIGTRY